MQIFHVLRVDGVGERAVGQAAAVQRGLVHRLQLGAAGLGPSPIVRLVNRGWLYPVLPRVYAVGHPKLMPLARELAVLLYLGRDAVISHWSAAAIWRLMPHLPGGVQVTLAGRAMRPRPDVEAHRVAGFDRREIRLREGMPVTSPARTLLDLAGFVEDDELARALAEARVMGLVRPRDLGATIAASPLRTGAGRLRALLAAEGEPAVTRSEAERRLRALIDGAQLPGAQFNVQVRGYLVDVLWVERRLVVEVDGHRFHGHRAAFERDRKRDQTLTAAGYRVIRVTWRQLQQEPLSVVARIAQTLSTPAPGR